MPVRSRSPLLYATVLPLLLQACSSESLAPLQLNILVPSDPDVNRIEAYRAQVVYEGGDTTGLVYQYTLTPGESNGGLRAGLPLTEGAETIQISIEGLVPDAASSTDQDTLYTALFLGTSGRFPFTAESTSIDVFVGKLNALNVLQTPLAAARTWHTATLLDDGSVLIAGGADDQGAGQSALERFDAGWTSGHLEVTAAGDMGLPRVHHTASPTIDSTSGSSRVLFAGGDAASRLRFEATALIDPTTSNLYTLALPVLETSATAIEPTRALELYDPAQGSIAAMLDLAEPRTLHQAAALASGDVLMCGGLVPSADPAVLAPTRSCVLYRNGGLLPLDMQSPRLYHQVTALQSGEALVTGGIQVTGFDDTTQVLSRVERFQGGTALEDAEQLAVARAGHSAVRLPDGRVLISGGFTSTRAPGAPQEGYHGRVDLLASAEVFDPAEIDSEPNTRPSQLTGTMVYPRAFHSSVLLSDDYVLIVGGVGLSLGDPLPPELYSIADGTFVPLEAAGQASVAGAAAVLLPDTGYVLVSGGAWYSASGSTDGSSSLRLFVPEP